jgi:hypothetical protein
MPAQKRKHPPGKPVWVKKTAKAKGHWRAKPIRMSRVDSDRVYDLKVDIDNNMDNLKYYRTDDWLQDAESELDWKLSEKAQKIRAIQRKYKTPKSKLYTNKNLENILDVGTFSYEAAFKKKKN